RTAISRRAEVSAGASADIAQHLPAWAPPSQRPRPGIRRARHPPRSPTPQPFISEVRSRRRKPRVRDAPRRGFDDARKLTVRGRAWRSSRAGSLSPYRVLRTTALGGTHARRERAGRGARDAGSCSALVRRRDDGDESGRGRGGERPAERRGGGGGKPAARRGGYGGDHALLDRAALRDEPVG